MSSIQIKGTFAKQGRIFSFPVPGAEGATVEWKQNDSPLLLQAKLKQYGLYAFVQSRKAQVEVMHADDSFRVEFQSDEGKNPIEIVMVTEGLIRVLVTSDILYHRVLSSDEGVKSRRLCSARLSKLWTVAEAVAKITALGFSEEIAFEVILETGSEAVPVLKRVMEIIRDELHMNRKRLQDEVTEAFRIWQTTPKKGLEAACAYLVEKCKWHVHTDGTAGMYLHVLRMVSRLDTLPGDNWASSDDDAAQPDAIGPEPAAEVAELV